MLGIRIGGLIVAAHAILVIPATPVIPAIPATPGAPAILARLGIPALPAIPAAPIVVAAKERDRMKEDSILTMPRCIKI